MTDAPVKTTHTPGPWVGFVDRSSDTAIFSVLPAGRAGEIASNIENDADARLIAAAPEMLAALQLVLAYYGKPKRDEWLNDAAFAEGVYVNTQARAAIAKAVHRRPITERTTSDVKVIDPSSVEVDLARKIERELCNGFRQYTLQGAELDWVIAALRRNYEKSEREGLK